MHNDLMTPTIEFAGFSRQEGGRAVVSEIDLFLTAGRICLLAGPEGAGKTTLIKSLVGLKAPSRGDVFINGVSIRRDEILVQRRRIGFLADPPILYEQLTAREFLCFIGDLYGMGKELPDRISEFLELFSLTSLADRLICSYPAESRARLGLVSALFHHPEILILDEPAFLRKSLQAAEMHPLLRSFKERGGLGIITAPSLEIAPLPYDRLLVLHEARLRFDGTPSQLRRHFHADPETPLQSLFQRLTRPRSIFL